MLDGVRRWGAAPDPAVRWVRRFVSRHDDARFAVLCISTQDMDGVGRGRRFIVRRNLSPPIHACLHRLRRTRLPGFWCQHTAVQRGRVGAMDRFEHVFGDVWRRDCAVQPRLYWLRRWVPRLVDQIRAVRGWCTACMVGVAELGSVQYAMRQRPAAANTQLCWVRRLLCGPVDAAGAVRGRRGEAVVRLGYQRGV